MGDPCLRCPWAAGAETEQLNCSSVGQTLMRGSAGFESPMLFYYRHKEPLSGNWSCDSDKLDGEGIGGSGEFFPVARKGLLPEQGLLSPSSCSALLQKMAKIV